MTLLKQTTISKADDSLVCTEENEEDLQTDCCPFSLEKELQTLTLGEEKVCKSQHSCESGIASFSANYSLPSAEDADLLKQSGPGLIKHETAIKSEQKCPTVKALYPNDHNTAETAAVRETTTAESGKKNDTKSERNVNSWQEVCGSFPDKDGDTLLHLAILQTVTHLAHLVRLLGLQEQVNCRNRLYQTPLHLAVLTGNTPALAVLKGLGASLCLQDCRGNTPLHTACLRNDPHALRELLEGQVTEDTCTDVGEDGTLSEVPQSKASSSARSRDELRASEALSQKDSRNEELSGGCDVDDGRKDPPEAGGLWTGDVGVDTEGGDVGRRMVREVKVALCAKNYEGLTCLHLAVLRGNAELVALLLQHGADVNARDGKSGRTALHLAVDTPHPSSPVLSALFLHPHLHINATNFAQQTALQLARGRHHLDLVDVLHMRGARWSDSIHGYYSSDSLSEEDVEEDLFVPYDDLRVAGQLLTAAKCS